MLEVRMVVTLGEGRLVTEMGLEGNFLGSWKCSLLELSSSNSGIHLAKFIKFTHSSCISLYLYYMSVKTFFTNIFNYAATNYHLL